LEKRVILSNDVGKRHEAHVAIEFLLAQRAGDDRRIESQRDEVSGNGHEQFPEHISVAIFLLDREQADFADAPALRQKRVEVGQLEVQREGALAAGRHHPDHLFAGDANRVGVFPRETCPRAALPRSAGAAEFPRRTFCS
jgi:hypothetical protein